MPATETRPTDNGLVLPNEDAAEIERMYVSFKNDLRPTTDAGDFLVRRMATLAIRLDRCAFQENAAISVRVRQAEADFVPPDDVDEATADELRAEAGRRAIFDPSKEACLARKYESAAERGFFRALKELRLVEKEAKRAEARIVAAPIAEPLGSFLPGAVERLGSSLPVVAKPLGSFSPRAVSPSPIAKPKVETPYAMPKIPTSPSPIASSKPTKESLLAWDPVPLNHFELTLAGELAR